MRITRGLRSSLYKWTAYTSKQVLAMVRNPMYEDLYEVLSDSLDTVRHRRFLDIDGKGYVGTKAAYAVLNKTTKDLLVAAFPGACILGSSNYNAGIVSFRVVCPELCTRNENKAWAASLNLGLGFPLAIDLSVYGAGRKMRLVNQSKDGEFRPLELLVGDLESSFITGLDAQAQEVEMVETERPKKKARTEDVKAPRLRQLLAALAPERLANHDEWIKVGMCLYSALPGTNLYELWEEWTGNKRTSCRARWDEFKEVHVNLGTLWKMLRGDSHTVYEALNGGADYDSVKARVEEEFFWMEAQSCYGRWNEGELHHLTEAQIKGHLRVESFHQEGNLHDFLKVWLNDKDRRVVKKVVFKPGKAVMAEGELNLFLGWPLQPGDADEEPDPDVEEAVGDIRDVLRNVCGDEAPAFEYVERYFAHILQKPGELPGVGLVLRGEAGIGKDFVLAVLRACVGDKYYKLMEPPFHDLAGKFNGTLGTCIVGHLGEMDSSHSRPLEAQLKQVITASSRRVEHKGRESITVQNYIRIICTSNKFLPVQVGTDVQRKWFIVAGGTRIHKDMHDFWERMYGYLDNPAVLRAYMSHLLSIDLKGWHASRKPATAAEATAHAASRPFHAEYFQGLVMGGGEFQASSSVLAPSTRVVKTGEDILREMNANKELLKFPLKPQNLKQELEGYRKSGCMDTKRKNFGNEYTIHLDRVREYLVEKNWWIEL